MNAVQTPATVPATVPAVPAVPMQISATAFSPAELSTTIIGWLNSSSAALYLRRFRQVTAFAALATYAAEGKLTGDSKGLITNGAELIPATDDADPKHVFIRESDGQRFSTRTYVGAQWLGKLSMTDAFTQTPGPSEADVTKMIAALTAAQAAEDARKATANAAAMAEQNAALLAELAALRAAQAAAQAPAPAATTTAPPKVAKAATTAPKPATK